MKSKFYLSRQALLFDSPLFILKSFVGVWLAYGLFVNHPIIGKDMISVLFGMMLTLEPVNNAGFKSGIGQVKSTLLGGLVAFVIVTIGGVNMLTVPLAVAITLYIALINDWRNVPAVAIFTAIYMTQYIQYDLTGMPSMWLTLRLRMLALGSGIGVAVFMNYVFSLFFYKKMIAKRAINIFEQLTAELSFVNKKETHQEDFKILFRHMISYYKDIDFIADHLSDDNKRTEYILFLEELQYLVHDFANYFRKFQSVDFSERDKETIRSYQAILKQFALQCGDSKSYNKSNDILEEIKQLDDEDEIKLLMKQRFIAIERRIKTLYLGREL